MKIALALPLLTSLFLVVPAKAAQVRFTGDTTANVTLIQDALRNVMLFGSSQGCSSLELVEARVLSPGYVPKDAATRPEAGKGTYEAWTATLCGKPTKFLITFWPAAEGGMMFAVTYPYPADAP